MTFIVLGFRVFGFRFFSGWLSVFCRPCMLISSHLKFLQWICVLDSPIDTWAALSCDLLVPVHLWHFKSHWAPETHKTRNATRKTRNSLCISIKTHGTGLKHYHTSQSYLLIPLFYPMRGNTHSSMFSFFGSEKNENRKRETTKQETNCIWIKTHGTGLKLYHTSQSYLSIPLFYPVG